jgi:uncharacterized protein
MDEIHGFVNHLTDQKSPYLIEHSRNPVDWYPWSEEAFLKAAREDKPVFLSIGYSACHWCHVMARESFEDDTVARLLNESFISVKVDREERPDIDKVYMNVCTMMTGSGGWPLTIFMTPGKKPFFAATFLPKESRFGTMGLIELVEKVRMLWKDERNEVNTTAENVSSVLRELQAPKKEGIVGADVSTRAFELLAGLYDPVYGGLGGAPKFPTPHNFVFLLRYWQDSGVEKAGAMALDSLRQIRMGGIFDQVGLGFHRYSTDEKWLLPHFEKMLYDQAGLALAYLEAYQANGDPFFSSVAREIFEYVMRDLTSPEGGFYSAENADSEGKEGRYYLWTIDEIAGALDGAEADVARRIFNLHAEGNFRDEATGKKTGENILYLSELPNDPGAFGSIRKKLLAARGKRVRPTKDDKILTDWNGLMIASLVRGALQLDDSRYLHAAEEAAAFVISRMMGEGDRLFHRYRDGEASIMGNLDDYAFLSWGLIELYEYTFIPEYLDLAVRLMESVFKYFLGADGRLLFSPVEGEEVIARISEYADGAYPSGNSIMFYNLTRLGRMTGNPIWKERADMVLRSASESIGRYPHAHTMFLTGLQYARGDSCEVVLTGDASDSVLTQMIWELHHYMPRCIVLVKFSEPSDQVLVRIAPYVRDMVPREGKTTAYVCTRNRCIKPVHTVDEMMSIIKCSTPACRN